MLCARPNPLLKAGVRSLKCDYLRSKLPPCPRLMGLERQCSCSLAHKLTANVVKMMTLGNDENYSLGAE